MKIIAWVPARDLRVRRPTVVSLNRWGWNRALFLVDRALAEIGLATALVLRRLTRMEYSRTADRAVSDVLRGRPAAPDRIAGSSGRPSRVVITFLVGGGVLISGIAWSIVALRRRRRRGGRTALHARHADRLSAGRPASRRHHRPRADHQREFDADRKLCGAPSTVAERCRRLMLVVVGVTIGVVAVIACGATQSTHDTSLRIDQLVFRRIKDAEKGQRSPRWCRRRCSPAPRGARRRRPISHKATADSAVLTPSMDGNQRQFVAAWRTG
jgi:hypothetical protein